MLSLSDDLLSLGVNTKLHLYSIIKYLFDEQYEIGKGNTLNIYKKGVDKKSLDSILERALKNSRVEMKREALAKKLNWTLQKLDLVISKSNKFIQWDNQIVKLKSSINIQPEQINMLSDFLTKHNGSWIFNERVVIQGISIRQQHGTTFARLAYR